MPFGLANAPASFQQVINDVLRFFLDVFAVAYLDDILIYSTSQTQHDRHVRQSLEALARANLFVKLEKCLFDVTSVDFTNSGQTLGLYFHGFHRQAPSLLGRSWYHFRQRPRRSRPLFQMVVFVPCRESMDATALAKLLLRHVFCKHGFPLSIVSDRGTLFTSAFFTELTKILGIRQKPHPTGSIYSAPQSLLAIMPFPLHPRNPPSSSTMADSGSGKRQPVRLQTSDHVELSSATAQLPCRPRLN